MGITFMQLFDDMQRTYTGVKEPQESSFAFLNRSAQPKYEYTRRLLEQWFQDYPVRHRKALSTSFRAKEDKIHLGAFFELYCYALLKHQGFLTETQQVVDKTVGRPIDFVVFSSKTPLFYLEATLAADSDDISVSQRILWQLHQALNALDEPNFRLHLKVERESVHSLPTTQISADIHGWLQKLDPDKVSRKEGILKYEDNPYCYLERDGWKITFIAVPRPVEQRGKPRDTVLSQSPSEAQWGSTQNSLRKALESKAKRYGELDLPYVIAVDILALNSLSRDIEEVLFGQEVIIYDKQSEEIVLARSPHLPNRPFQENGFWAARSGPRNRQVSAVLLVDELMPWSAARRTPILWHNPWADKPLNPDIWQGVQMIPDKDALQMEYREGKKAWELLNLDQNWPDSGSRGL